MEKRKWQHGTAEKTTKLKECAEVASVRISIVALLCAPREYYVASTAGVVVAYFPAKPFEL